MANMIAGKEFIIKNNIRVGIDVKNIIIIEPENILINSIEKLYLRLTRKKGNGVKYENKSIKGPNILYPTVIIAGIIPANKDINIIASVCTGSLLLAKAGLLDNKKATSHWGALKLLKKLSPSTQILTNEKFVFDTYYTSAGVSAGINMSLHIIEKLLGKKIAQNTAKYKEHDY